MIHPQQNQPKIQSEICVQRQLTEVCVIVHIMQSLGRFSSFFTSDRQINLKKAVWKTCRINISRNLDTETKNYHLIYGSHWLKPCKNHVR